MKTSFESVEEIEEITENWSASDWVNAHNQYCREQNSSDDEIFDFDDEFFGVFFESKPMEAARATHFGNVNWSDDYIRFNGYGNLESLNKHTVEQEIDKDAILSDMLENPENYDL